MRVSGAALLVLCGAVLLPAQNTGRLQVTVIDSVTRQPVRKAQVIAEATMLRQPATPNAERSNFMRGRLLSGVTDVSGLYMALQVALGEYVIRVSHPQYTRLGQMISSEQVSVSEDSGAKVTVVLQPLSSMSGRVVDEEGDPLTGCSVTLRKPDARQNQGIGGVGISDETGEYRLWAIEPGKWMAMAACPRPLLQPRPLSPGPPPEPTIGWLPQVYPAASDLASAQPIELAPGMEKAGIDFQMKSGRVYKAGGSLTSAGGDWRNRQDVVLQVHPAGAMAAAHRYRLDRVKGAWVVSNLVPGSYILSVFSNDDRQEKLGVYYKFTVADQDVIANLQLRPAIDMTGKLVVEGESKLPEGSLNLQFFPAETFMSYGQSPQVTIRPDGTVLAKGVLPGRWRVQVHNSPNAFLKKVTRNGQEASGRVLDLTGGLDGPLEFIFSTRVATVRGTATPGLRVTAISEDQDGGIQSVFSTAITDATGNFTLNGLPPGEHRLRTSSPNRGPASDDMGLKVEVAEGETLTVKIP